MNRRPAALFVALLTIGSLAMLAGPALALDSPWDIQRFAPAQPTPPSAVGFDFDFDFDFDLDLDPDLDLGLGRGFGLGLSQAIIPVLTRVESLEDEFSFESLDEKLDRIPLRPVVLGETPRIPWDPERSFGLVFYVPFSL
jgi:hypothetical protein